MPEMRDQVNQIIHHLDPRSVASMTGALDAVKEINDLDPEEKSALTKALCEVFSCRSRCSSLTTRTKANTDQWMNWAKYCMVSC